MDIVHILIFGLLINIILSDDLDIYNSENTCYNSFVCNHCQFKYSISKYKCCTTTKIFDICFNLIHKEYSIYNKSSEISIKLLDIIPRKYPIKGFSNPLVTKYKNYSIISYN